MTRSRRLALEVSSKTASELEGCRLPKLPQTVMLKSNLRRHLLHPPSLLCRHTDRGKRWLNANRVSGEIRGTTFQDVMSAPVGNAFQAPYPPRLPLPKLAHCGSAFVGGLGYPCAGYKLIDSTRLRRKALPLVREVVSVFKFVSRKRSRMFF